MTIRRLTLDTLTPRTWDALTGDRFFASSGFASLWRARGGTPVAWTAERDGTIAAIMPGVEFGRGPLTRFMSMPDGCYGGLCWAPDVGPERARIAAAILGAVSRHPYLRVWIFDFYHTLAEADDFRVDEAATTLVDISSSDWCPPDSKLRSQIRKAEREGIRVEAVDWTRHRDAFLTLAASTAARHGVEMRLTAAFYRRLADLAGRDDRVRWYMCEHDGRPACSHIYVVEGGRLQGWQVQFDKAYSFLKPNQYIRFTVCREMAKLGVRELNLGASPAGSAGLAYYKRRWGGRTYRYPAYAKQTVLGRLIMKARG